MCKEQGLLNTKQCQRKYVQHDILPFTCTYTLYFIAIIIIIELCSFPFKRGSSKVKVQIES